MLIRVLGIASAAVLLAASPVAADRGDRWEKQWEKRAECDRELAKLDREQRREAAKEWRKAEKKWRERNRYYQGGYYDWDD